MTLRQKGILKDMHLEMTKSPSEPLLVAIETHSLVADGSRPVRIEAKVARPSKMTLTLFRPSGEPVYEMTDLTPGGTWSHDWTAVTETGIALQSGLYVALLEANDGKTVERRTLRVMVRR